MVKLDLSIKEVVGLADINSISKEKYKDLLNQFEKEDLVTHLLNEYEEGSDDKDLDI